MSHGPSIDVAVVGGGIVGATAAALLGRAGFGVVLVEATAPKPFDRDQPVGLRVSAVSPGSQAVFAEAGAWGAVDAERHGIYRRMVIEDGAGSDAARPLASIQFDAPAFGLERLGTIVENDLLLSALWAALEAAGVERRVPGRVVAATRHDDHMVLELEDGDVLRARLVVGADGPRSEVRRLLGDRVERWHYNQRGVVAVVDTEHGNPGVAWQRFLTGGPLAFLPLADGRSSIVWSRPDAEARALESLDEAAFLEALDAASGAPFGAARSVGPRASFPLTMQLAGHYRGPRAALLGDAAHVVHPLAGQGANLGILDAAGLVERLVHARQAGDDIGGERTLRAFDLWRRSESESMAMGIHRLRTLFSASPLAPLRAMGMRFLAKRPLLQAPLIERASGRHSGAPALARGVRLVDLLTQPAKRAGLD